MFDIWWPLGMQSLHFRMPFSVDHTSDVCFQPSQQQGCLQVGLFRKDVCLRRSGCQHEQRMVNRVKASLCTVRTVPSHSTYATLLWVLNTVVNVVWIPLLFISLPQDAHFHPELITWLKLFSVWPSRVNARSSSRSKPATCATSAWRFLQCPPTICAAKCLNSTQMIYEGAGKL